MISLIYLMVWFVDVHYLLPVDSGLKQNFQHVEISFISYIQYCGIASVLLGAVVGLAIFKKWVNFLTTFSG